MDASIALRTVVIALLLVSGNVGAQESVPIVYEDDFVTVHAGLPESGSRAVHLGDALSLVITVVFDAGQVQVENLDDKVFQRAFSDSPNIRLHTSATLTTKKDSHGRVRASSYWRLQVLDCPDDLVSCPGPRSYELPLMTVAYQLIDNAGSAADGRAARFRPWPGKIDVATAVAIVAESGETINDILPGGAYDSQQPVAEVAPARSVLFVAAAILLLTAFFVRARDRRPPPLLARTNYGNSRWEQTLARLSDDSISDEEFSDLLRRCATWYCLDELGQNPYAWLGESAGNSDTPAGMYEFFLDVLQQQGIGRGQRTDYIDKLLGVTGRARDASTAEQGT
jgi:hypothetical protein